jgi:hypothetical protein
MIIDQVFDVSHDLHISTLSNGSLFLRRLFLLGLEDGCGLGVQHKWYGHEALIRALVYPQRVVEALYLDPFYLQSC